MLGDPLEKDKDFKEEKNKKTSHLGDHATSLYGGKEMTKLFDI